MDVKRFVASRLRRSASSFEYALRLGLCAVGAYSFAHLVLGHTTPTFAAVSALITLQFSNERRLPRAVQVAGGCTAGVILGGVLATALGRGAWQALVIVVVTVTVARILGGGPLFATQLAIQSLLVSMAPVSFDGVLATSVDSAVGGASALIAVALVPERDTRRPGRAVLRLTAALAKMLDGASQALLEGSPQKAWSALLEGRETQQLIENAARVVEQAGESAVFSPLRWSRRGYVSSLEEGVRHVDFALRGSRIFCRRLVFALEHRALDTAGRLELASLLDGLSGASIALGHELVRDSRTLRAEADGAGALAEIAAALDPEHFADCTVEGQSLVLLLRPIVADLLAAAGENRAAVLAALPALPRTDR
ncbi:FUSC family protein [Sinomonas sp. JGH33]|uniref:FUSC family protein n=1 Tax=Sinomonas terricola TaxID=3110330 RepID=A0ABU5T5H2_9MICC|nr:FUSC family protein [Sinomonas sp. JGH33]MEA5454736.1 FUSC family protein [Sinomonas sp. JGH33]